MTTTTMGDQFDEVERNLEWLEQLESLQARSASERAAFEVAEYVMKLRGAVLALAGTRTVDELGQTTGTETAQLVAELREEGDNDQWNSRIRPALLKTES